MCPTTVLSEASRTPFSASWLPFPTSWLPLPSVFLPSPFSLSPLQLVEPQPPRPIQTQYPRLLSQLSALSQLYSLPRFRSPMATVPALPHSLYPSPLAVPVPSSATVPAIKMCMSPLWPDLTHAQTPIPRRLHQARYIVLGCGSFVRGRKRKKGDSIPFILSRRDYMSRLHDECPKRASTTSDKLSSIPIIYIPNPFSTWQSSNADPVK